MPADGDYDAILAAQLRPLPPEPDALELVRYATLAANSHNTQPWRFRVGTDAIAIEPDVARRTAVVDPDDHHLYASLGCAAENLSLAIAARGGAGEVAFDAAGAGRLNVSTAAGSTGESPLFAAIPMRQCSRAVYTGEPVPADVVARLVAAASVGGVEPVVIADERKAALRDLVLAGNGQQLADPAFRTELKSWLRFNKGAVAATRDGLFSAASGNPSLPNWLGPLMYDLTVSKDGDNKRVMEQIDSSAGLIVFVAETNDPAGWISAGRAYQRFALQATLEGLKHAFVNQAVEVSTVRREVALLLGIGEQRPNLIIRFGYGPDMPRSLRRAAEDVVVA